MAVISAEALAKLGFSDEIAPRRPSAVFSIAGLEGSGKTDWALTAPKPLGYLSTDFGDDGVIQKHDIRQAAYEGRGYPGQIIRPKKGDYKLNAPAPLKGKQAAETDQARQAREGELARWIHDNFYVPFAADQQALIGAGVRTIVWDNAVDVWEYVRLSVYGRGATSRQDLQTEANAKFKELVRDANVAGVNLIMINHLKAEWESYESNGGTKWRKTDRLEMHGNDKNPFLVAASLWTKFTSPATWSLTIKKCRDTPSMTGATFENQTFADVVSILMPDVPAEAWNE